MADRLAAPSPASVTRPAHVNSISSVEILDLNERRIALDGEAYTFEEFATYYGFATGLANWQNSKCLDSSDSVEQPVGTTASHPDDSAEQPVAMTASHLESQSILLSWDQLVAMTRSKGCGGKAANVEQKRIRQHCFANGLWEIDLSDSTFEW